MDLMEGATNLCLTLHSVLESAPWRYSALPPFNGFSVSEWFFLHINPYSDAKIDDFVLKLAGQLPSLCWH